MPGLSFPTTFTPSGQRRGSMPARTGSSMVSFGMRSRSSARGRLLVFYSEGSLPPVNMAPILENRADHFRSALIVDLRGFEERVSDRTVAFGRVTCYPVSTTRIIAVGKAVCKIWLPLGIATQSRRHTPTSIFRTPNKSCAFVGRWSLTPGSTNTFSAAPT